MVGLFEELYLCEWKKYRKMLVVSSCNFISGFGSAYIWGVFIWGGGGGGGLKVAMCTLPRYINYNWFYRLSNFIDWTCQELINYYVVCRGPITIIFIVAVNCVALNTRYGQIWSLIIHQIFFARVIGLNMSCDAAKTGVYQMIFPTRYSPVFELCDLRSHV